MPGGSGSKSLPVSPEQALFPEDCSPPESGPYSNTITSSPGAPSSVTSSPLNSLTLDLPPEPKKRLTDTSTEFQLNSNSPRLLVSGSANQASSSRSPPHLQGYRVMKVKPETVGRSSSSRDGGSQFYLSQFSSGQTPPPIRSNTLRSQRSNSETSLNSHSPLSIPNMNRRLPLHHPHQGINVHGTGLVPSRIASSDYHSDTSSSNDFCAHNNHQTTWFLHQPPRVVSQSTSMNPQPGHDHNPPHFFTNNNHNNNNNTAGLINRHQIASSAEKQHQQIRAKFQHLNLGSPSHPPQINNHKPVLNNPVLATAAQINHQHLYQQNPRGPLDRFRSKSTSNKSSGSSCSGR